MSEQYEFNNIRAIIGLGNPGPKYARTRHNMGFRLLEELARLLGKDHWHSSEKMEYVSIQHPGPAGGSLYLIKPQTFMNSSGEVLPWLTKKGIKADQILVVHDELEKAFGNLSIKKGGSARGHNGLRSLMVGIGEGFWRLRFGIGRPADDKVQVGDFVLAPLDPAEEASMPNLLKQAANMALK